MDDTPTTRPPGRTADAVRSRSRDVYEALLDRIEQRVNSADEFTLSELAQAANVAGRIGLGGEEQRDGAITIRIVRDTVEPQATARLLYEGATTLPSHVDNPVTVDASTAYADTVTAMARERDDRRTAPRDRDDA